MVRAAKMQFFKIFVLKIHSKSLLCIEKHGFRSGTSYLFFCIPVKTCTFSIIAKSFVWIRMSKRQGFHRNARETPFFRAMPDAKHPLPLDFPKSCYLSCLVRYRYRLFTCSTFRLARKCLVTHTLRCISNRECQ